MKNLIILLLFPMLGITQNFKFEKNNGFKQFVFGTSPAEYKNLTLEIDEGNLKLYSLNQAGKIDGIEFEYIHLTFCKNKLSAISLKTKNLTGEKLLRSLIEENGAPTKSLPQNDKYEWANKKVQLLFDSSNGKDAAMDLYNNKLGL